MCEEIFIGIFELMTDQQKNKYRFFFSFGFTDLIYNIKVQIEQYYYYSYCS